MKRTLKKAISILLAAAVVFGTLAFGFSDVDWSEFAVKAEAAEEYTEEYAESYYTYTVDENGNATITDFDDTVSGDIVIPSTLGGYSVTGIEAEAFSGSGLKSVTIPAGVTSIGYYAFYNCTGLSRATIPDSVTSIGYRAFYNCIGLSSVTIGSGVKNIGHEAFASCGSLETTRYSGTPEQWENISVGTNNNKLNENIVFECNSGRPYYLPKTLGENLAWKLYTDGELVISGNGAMPNWSDSSSAPWYSERSGIKKITIENGITNIGDYAFYDFNVTSVTIPESVTRIGDYAFYSCNITSLTIPKSVTHIGSYAFYWCYNLSNITISGGVTYIGDHAFYLCEKLTSIILPETISYIGDYAFASCYNLTSAYYPLTHEDWKKVTVGDYNYYLTSNIIDFNSKRPCYAPGTCGEDLIWTLYLDGELVINGTGEMTDWSSAAKVPWYSKRSIIKTATVKNGVTNIDKEAFSSCCDLTSIKIGNSITTICDNAFTSCESLTSITVDSANPSYSSDEYGVLFNKDKTKLIKYPEGNTRTDYEIPYGVTNIGRSAFSYCVTKNIIIPDSVTFIGEYAFCSAGIKNITMSNSIKTISDNAFYDCGIYMNAYYPGTQEQWKEVSVGKYNESLTDNLIFECNSERPYYLSGSCGDNLTYKLYTDGELTIEGTGDMWNYKVRNAGSNDSYVTTPWYDKRYEIKKVTISDNVNSIGDYAFARCNYFTNIVIPADVTRIGDYAFSLCLDLSDVYYSDTEEEWNEILVGERNDYLSSATIHYNYVPGEETTSKPVESTTESTTASPAVTEPSTAKPIEETTTKPVEVPTTSKPEITETSTTKPIEEPTTKPVEESTTKPVEVPSTTKPAEVPTTEPSIPPVTDIKTTFEIRKPSQTEITYGDSIILHADFESKIPDGAKVIWSTDNGNFTIVESSANGTSCVVTPESSGNTVFIATLVDADGNVLDSDTQTMTSKAGFFQKIIAFFKKIFGMTKIISEAIKH